MEYVLKRLLITFVHDSFITGQIAGNRYSTLLALPYAFSLLLNIYQSREPKISEAYTNRTESFYNIVFFTNLL